MKKLPLIILLFLTFMSTTLMGKTDRDIALIFKVKGKVNIVKAENNRSVHAKRGSRLDAGDQIRTDQDGFTALIFTDDKSMMKIRGNSDVIIRGKRQKKTFTKRIFMEMGEAWVHVSPQVASDFRIETPTGVAAVKGTEFYTIVDQDGNVSIFATKGIVELINQLGTVLVHAGESGFSDGKSEPKVKKIKPGQAPGWAKSSSTGEEKVLDIEFEDKDGTKKHMKIYYK
ncbi:MAG: FecR domain-containing protein [Calditrichaeota bacterium]|nr:FecR domain-containing protein [Calditrichota bacterium]